jgi:hypothetical protein
MELALATANYLRPIADALVYINTTKVHPVWFPYAIAPTLHAARISIVYQSNARRSPSALSWGTYITGYLIMVCTLRPYIRDCVGWNSTFTVLGRRSPFTFLSWGPATNALFIWSSYKLSYCPSFRYLVLPVFP